MSEDRVNEAAALLAQAWSGDAPLDAWPEALVPVDAAEAYAIQDAFCDRVGDQVVGWTVGFGSSAPIVGRIFKARLHGSPAVLSTATYPQPNLDCEVAFLVRDALPQLRRPYTPADLFYRVRAFAAVGLTGRRVRGAPHSRSDEREQWTILADNAAGAGLIVGPEIEDWRDRGINAVEVALQVDGETADPIPDLQRRDPVDVLLWLASHLAGRGLRLEPGQYIATGTLTMPTPLRPGSAATALFRGIGEISVRLE
jgi:2-keto-4-pentenoate hydratase